MSKNLFFYDVIKSVNIKDTDAEGKPITRTEQRSFPECFNLNCVIRGIWADENTFGVLLNDGHEQAEDVQKPVVKNGKVVDTELKRERGWYYSQVNLTGKDIERFRVASELAVYDYELPKTRKEEVVLD